MQSIEKKYKLFSVISGVMSIVLMIAVVFLYRQNIELKRVLSEITASQRNQSLIEPEYLLSKKSNRPEPNNNDKEKIKELESQIADMQDWQDYLEDSLQLDGNENEEKEDIAKSAEAVSWFLSNYIDDFAKVNNLTLEKKEQLLNLLPEIEHEAQRIYSEDNSGKGINQLYQNYLELISDMLPEESSAYKEYKKVEEERKYITGFKNSMLSGDNQLDAHQEQSLITALYEENQNFKENHTEKKHNSKIYDIEYMKEQLKTQKILHNSYIDVASNILSDTQLKKF